MGEISGNPEREGARPHVRDLPRLLVSAAHKSSGKTTLSIGLCAAIRARGLKVQPFKKGPDYIDPLWLGLAAGRPCYNLDFYLAGSAELLSTFTRHSAGADVSLIEGNKGLYDGLDLDGSNSNAALATLYGAPVILVLDARGMTRGIAPLILGYRQFAPEVHIAGVILNQLGGSRHEAKLRAVIEHYTDVPVLGALHCNPRLALVERHLGLMPSNEADDAASRIARIQEEVSNSVDIERLLAVARSAPALAVPDAPEPPPAPGTRIRVGIARDAAFAFYYPGDLDGLEKAGADLVPVDTLRDSRLPAIDALFIGGGFPETHMKALEANAPLRRSIRGAIESGLPVYAECGGLMYLARGIQWQGYRAEMVGAIPADIVMHERPVGRGYVRLRETGDGPWPAEHDTPREIRAHEFHYSSVENLPENVTFAYEVLRGHGIDGKHDGIVHKNVLASYSHLRDVATHRWTRRFVRFAAEQRALKATINH
ncbi:MAG: cobyrinate a,c-diamide synthase [Acidiferrobacteraceae bacterium]